MTGNIKEWQVPFERAENQPSGMEDGSEKKEAQEMGIVTQNDPVQ